MEGYLSPQGRHYGDQGVSAPLPAIPQRHAANLGRKVWVEGEKIGSNIAPPRTDVAPVLSLRSGLRMPEGMPDRLLEECQNAWPEWQIECQKVCQTDC